MSLSDLYNILNSIEGFKGKIAYRMFPVNEAPTLPYICFLETNTTNFKADGKVYRKIQNFDIELYTLNKDTKSEELIENALNDNDIAWDKYEEYIEDEHCYEIVYEITIQGE